jgi:hypothetical protein
VPPNSDDEQPDSAAPAADDAVDEAAENDETADSRLATLSRTQALLALVALVVAIAGFVLAVVAVPASTVAREAAQKPDARFHDSDLYRAIIARVHAGQNYYDAAGAELRGRHYPTRPAFNWREPTYAWLLGHFPWPNVLLVALDLTTLILSFVWIRQSWSTRAALAVVLLHVGALPFGPDPVVFQEVWAGSFIILSATLYALGRWPLGMAAALVALCFREHALLPCGVAFLLALQARRWVEVRLWVVSLVAWVALMALHLHTVEQHLGPADFVIKSRNWVAFGGPRFLVSLVGFDAYAGFLPPALAAPILPLALFGYADWRNDGAVRMGLTLLGFLLAFSVVGLPFNSYWGSLFMPLMSVGLVRAPFALQQCWRAARPRTTQLSPASPDN